MRHISPILDREVETLPTRYGRDGWTLVRCAETGLVFLPNPPDYAELETEMAWEVTAQKERERRNQEEPVLSRASTLMKFAKRRLFPKRNKMVSIVAAEMVKYPPPHVSVAGICVVDVGCGEGTLLVNLHRQCSALNLQADFTGIEVSKELAVRTRQALASAGATAARVVQNNALAGICGLEINAQIVVMRSFLEHEKHPARLLKAVWKILATDGVVVVKVPNFACWNRMVRGNRWCGFRYPDHVNYWTPATLRRLAHETGFVVSRQTLLDRFPTSDNMYAVLRKKG